ncbi:hypothetical protein [Comamonas testosteroni]|nr:hypothetical protein [Comamonas testosteroni]
MGGDKNSGAAEAAEPRQSGMSWADNKWEQGRRFFGEYAAYLILFGLVVALWILWYVWGADFLGRMVCANQLDTDDCTKLTRLGQVGDLFGGVNALFAALAFAAVAYSSHLARKVYQSDREIEQDQIYAEQVKTSYEWAFAAFTNGIPSAPLNSREIWLTTARHLIRAEDIAEYIKTPAHKLIVEEHREHWRRKFLQVVQMLEGEQNLHKTYFPGIEATSAQVILNFTHWPEEREDPIDWAKEHGSYPNSYKGKIGIYLREYMQEEIERKEEERRRRKAEKVR